MQGVAAGFSHGIDRTGGMLAILGRQRACLHFELLKRIRERKRKVEVVEGIVVSAAIKHVGRSIRQAAADAEHGLTGIVLGGNEIRERSGGSRAGEVDQIGRGAPVQREINDALLVDHLPDAGAAGFDHSGGCLDKHLLSNRADLQGSVDGRIRSHLQRDRVLYVGAEALLADLETILPGGKAYDGVAAIGASIGRPRQTRVGLDNLNLSAGYPSPLESCTVPAICEVAADWAKRLEHATKRATNVVNRSFITFSMDLSYRFTCEKQVG